MNNKSGISFVYGQNACLLLLKSSRRFVYKIYIQKNKHSFYLDLIDKRYHKIIEIVDENFLFIKTGEQNKHQGILIFVEEYKCLKSFKNSKLQNTIVILDQVQDPHNLGNIIRSCFCFNVQDIVIPQNNSCNINNSVARSSAGYLDYVNIYQVVNLLNAISEIKELGYWVIGFDVDETYKDANFIELINRYDKICMVFGSEGFGMRESVKKACDLIVKIPISPSSESLNVATAVAIAAYERSNKRITLPKLEN